MENAAAAAFRQLSALCPRLAGKQVWLLMGSGNNGGDAACLACYLRDAGACPHVFHTRPLEHYRNETAYHLQTARACGVPLPAGGRADGDAPRSPPSHILVDGLLGTGFSGQLRDDARRLISFVNGLSPRPLILSLDVPSGLDAASSLPCPDAVRADATVTFAAAKPGLMLPWARPYTGECHVGPIAMPARVREEGPCSFRLLDSHALDLLPAMTAASYKNTYGHILIMGAPRHVRRRASGGPGALRTGAGLSAAMPAAGEEQVRMGWPEIMTLPLGDTGNRNWPAQIPDDLRRRLHQCRALVIGPGMGRGEDSHAFLVALLKEPGRPACVFDADALMLLAGDPSLLAAPARGHPDTASRSEAAALLHCPGSAVQQDRMAALKACARPSPPPSSSKAREPWSASGTAPQASALWMSPAGRGRFRRRAGRLCRSFAGPRAGKRPAGPSGRLPGRGAACRCRADTGPHPSPPGQCGRRTGRCPAPGHDTLTG